MGSFLATVLIVLAWYGSNISVLLLNKFLLSSSFRQPVFLTLCHMLACVGLGAVFSLTNITPLKKVQSSVQIIKISVLSLLFCATIVLGNVSLKYIPVSFNQAVGSTTPFFTAIFALSLQGARESGFTYATLIPVVAGVVIASGGEPNFHSVGFLCCVLATAGRALKSVIQSVLLSDPNEKMDPMSLLFYMSSISVAILVPTSLVLEPQAGPAAYALLSGGTSFIAWMAANCSLAYAVNLTNFLVTKHTSALTLQVLGNAKGVIAAAVSVAVFRNRVTARGMLGYTVTVAGVFLYSEVKRRSKHIKFDRHDSSQGELQVDMHEETLPLKGHGLVPGHSDTTRVRASAV